MGKASTLAIQNQLVALGEQIGLRAIKEYSFPRKAAYNPRYDVVWFLNVKDLKINHVTGVELIEDQWLPLATFEVEGSTTSSKNQVGNVGNIMISPCQYHFMIVANQEAGKENDTYRRGVKIVRTMQQLMGEKNILFLDASMLPKQLENPTIISTNHEKNERSKGSGGETTSLPIAKKVIERIEKTNLMYEFDFTSPDFKMRFNQVKSQLKGKKYTHDPVTNKREDIRSTSNYYYCSKIDISAGFTLTGGFIEFLKTIAKNFKKDVELYPLLLHIHHEKINELYYPLLGIEIETGDSKHAIGGLINAGRLHQVGWLVGTDSMQGSVETYHYYLGLRNTHYIPINSL